MTAGGVGTKHAVRRVGPGLGFGALLYGSEPCRPVHGCTSAGRGCRYAGSRRLRRGWVRARDHDAGWPRDGSGVRGERLPGWSPALRRPGLRRGQAARPGRPAAHAVTGARAVRARHPGGPTRGAAATAGGAPGRPPGLVDPVLRRRQRPLCAVARRGRRLPAGPRHAQRHAHHVADLDLARGPQGRSPLRRHARPRTSSRGGGAASYRAAVQRTGDRHRHPRRPGGGAARPEGHRSRHEPPVGGRRHSGPRHPGHGGLHAGGWSGSRSALRRTP